MNEKKKKIMNSHHHHHLCCHHQIRLNSLLLKIMFENSITPTALAVSTIYSHCNALRNWNCLQQTQTIQSKQAASDRETEDKKERERVSELESAKYIKALFRFKDFTIFLCRCWFRCCYCYCHFWKSTLTHKHTHIQSIMDFDSSLCAILNWQTIGEVICLYIELREDNRLTTDKWRTKKIKTTNKMAQRNFLSCNEIELNTHG